MAISNKYTAPRGSRAGLNALASGGNLLAGQLYLVTDESRIAVGLTSTTYKDFARYDELNGNASSLNNQPASYYLNAANLNAGTLGVARLPAFTGDATSVAGNSALTLATVNGNVGTYGSATTIPQLTINAKGLVTGMSQVAVAPAWSSITSKPTTLSGFGITDAVGVMGGVANLGSSGSSHGYLRLHGAAANSEGNIYHDATYGIHMDTYSNAYPIRIDGSRLEVGSHVYAPYFSQSSPTNEVTSASSISSIFVEASGDGFHRKASGSALAGLMLSNNAAGSGTWQFNNTGRGTVNGNANFALQAYSTDAGSGAIMSFHRNGAYAINMGLDTDNVFRIGGWSAGANRLQMDMSGNLTMAGNISAYSDARLKTHVRTIEGALERICSMRGVWFDRRDTGEASSGVIAQEFEVVAPELVSEDNDGTKGVNYGGALGYTIEAIKELTARVARLEGES